MNERGVPTNLSSLRRRISNLVGTETLTTQRTRVMAVVVLSQMMPPSAIKGGTAMKIRLGDATSRFSEDLDVARGQESKVFVEELRESLRVGWNGFTGTLIEKVGPKPKGIPAEYIMEPFRVKMSYKGLDWTSVTLEVGHDELGDTLDSELRMAPEIIDLFTQVGLSAPNPVAVLAPKHQIAQKLHAASMSGSQRAHDLVDLQLLDAHESLELRDVQEICERLFNFRKAHSWPPVIIENEGWDSLYQEAAQGLPVLSSVSAAVTWSNDFIARIGAS